MSNSNSSSSHEDSDLSKQNDDHGNNRDQPPEEPRKQSETATEHPGPLKPTPEQHEKGYMDALKQDSSKPLTPSEKSFQAGGWNIAIQKQVDPFASIAAQFPPAWAYASGNDEDDGSKGEKDGGGADNGEGAHRQKGDGRRKMGLHEVQ